jgi:hypothetical protein
MFSLPGGPGFQGSLSSRFFDSRRGSSHLASCLKLCATRLVNVGRFRSRYRMARVYAAAPAAAARVTRDPREGPSHADASESIVPGRNALGRVRAVLSSVLSSEPKKRD